MDSVISDPEELSPWSGGGKKPRMHGFRREWAQRIWRTRARTAVLRLFTLKDIKRNGEGAGRGTEIGQGDGRMMGRVGELCSAGSSFLRNKNGASTQQ